MTSYEFWSLILTGVYDSLTFLLLVFTFYIAVIQRRIPNIALFYEVIPKDTKDWGWRRSNLDFVLENRGVELKRVTLKSNPDLLGWANMGEDKFEPKASSEYFNRPFTYLYPNQRKSFFWCDAVANKDVLDKPFCITVEFDNPIFFLPKRLKRKFDFDLSPRGIFDGVNSKFDTHNIAQEMARVRETLENMAEQMKTITDERESK